MCHKLGCVSTKPQPKQIKVSIQSPPQSKSNQPAITLLKQSVTAPIPALPSTGTAVATCTVGVTPQQATPATCQQVQRKTVVKSTSSNEREVRISVLPESVTRQEQSTGLILGQIPPFCEMINSVNNVTNVNRVVSNVNNVAINAPFALKAPLHHHQPPQHHQTPHQPAPSTNRANQTFNFDDVSILTLLNHQAHTVSQETHPTFRHNSGLNLNIGQIPAIVATNDDVDMTSYFTTAGQTVNFTKTHKHVNYENSRFTVNENIPGIPIKINKKPTRSEPHTFTQNKEDINSPRIPLVVEVTLNLIINPLLLFKSGLSG